MTVSAAEQEKTGLGNYFIVSAIVSQSAISPLFPAFFEFALVELVARMEPNSVPFSASSVPSVCTFAPLFVVTSYSHSEAGL